MFGFVKVTEALIDFERTITTLCVTAVVMKWFGGVESLFLEIILGTVHFFVEKVAH